MRKRKSRSLLSPLEKVFIAYFFCFFAGRPDGAIRLGRPSGWSNAKVDAKGVLISAKWCPGCRASRRDATHGTSDRG